MGVRSSFVYELLLGSQALRNFYGVCGGHPRAQLISSLYAHQLCVRSHILSEMRLQSL